MIQGKKSKRYTIVGNVCIGSSLACVVWMAIVMVVRWHNYQVWGPFTSFPLRSLQELTAIVFMVPAILLAVAGFILRGKGNRTRPMVKPH